MAEKPNYEKYENVGVHDDHKEPICSYDLEHGYYQKQDPSLSDAKKQAAYEKKPFEIKK